MRFWICCGYYGFIGLLFFIIGRILPKKWFDYNSFPYKAFDCEKDGKIYEKNSDKQMAGEGARYEPDISKAYAEEAYGGDRSGHAASYGT